LAVELSNGNKNILFLLKMCQTKRPRGMKTFPKIAYYYLENSSAEHRVLINLI
jgi:hypothetical protein